MVKILYEDIQAVKQRYPDISDEDFEVIIKLDPTYKDGSNSVGKYGKWLLNLFQKKALNKEDFYKVPDYLTDFENKRKMFTNKDIGQFKSIAELAKALDEVDDSNLSHSQKVRQAQKDRKNADLGNEAELVYEDSDWQIWIPKTYAASCKLGQGSHWCTATTEDDYYYKHYTESGPLYINLNKHDPDEMYQFHFESNSFMDKYDEEVDFLELCKHNSFGKYYADKYRNEHMQNPTVSVLLDSSDLKYIFDNVFEGSRDALGSDFCSTALVRSEDFYEDWWEGWQPYYAYYDDFNVDVREKTKEYLETKVLPKLGLDTVEQLDEIGTNSFDEDETDAGVDVDDIHRAIAVACDTGMCDGSMSECIDTISEAFQDWINDGLNGYPYELVDNAIQVSWGLEDIRNASDDEILDAYAPRTNGDYYATYDTYSDDPNKNHAVWALINVGRPIYEPRYGFQEFDQGAFEEDLIYRLEELIPNE